MKYKAISFFSGAMGLDIGIEKAGIDIRVCVDNDKHCCDTIRLNRPELPVLQSGIEALTTKEILEVAGLKKGDVFLVHGGPPCQAFSTAGSRKSLQDTRGNCILEYAKKVLEIEPEYFIMENVRGLLSAAINPVEKEKKVKVFEEQPGSALRSILELFNKAGYTVSFALFNSANYGVPQKRERMIFFGNKGSERIPLPQPTHSEDGLLTGKKWVSVREAFKNLNGEKHEFVTFSDKRKKYYRLLKAGQHWRSLPEELQEEAMGSSYHLGGGKTGFYRRLAWDAPSPTIVTRPNMPATDLCHPTKLRPLSVQEYKVIQQFPHSWELSGNILEKYKQIGNAVPVGLGYVAGKTILDFHLGKVTRQEPYGMKYSRYKNTTDRDLENKQHELSLSVS
ncbi:MAG: DNA cytosine methyltransferase [Candidatus Omnitrophica bacterium]|nr:DNA cytosine methyltransferase [Candidatus Omnitrophota bacterium]